MGIIDRVHSYEVIHLLILLGSTPDACEVCKGFSGGLSSGGSVCGARSQLYNVVCLVHGCTIYVVTLYCLGSFYMTVKS